MIFSKSALCWWRALFDNTTLLALASTTDQRLSTTYYHRTPTRESSEANEAKKKINLLHYYRIRAAIVTVGFCPKFLLARELNSVIAF